METFHSSAAAEPAGAYAHARRVGNLVFLAGIGPRQRGSKAIPGVVLGSRGEVVDYDVTAQIDSCWANVKLVLEEAGSSMEHIVDVTVFLTDMKRDFAAANAAWARIFAEKASQPCRTTVEIKSLPQAGDAPIAYEVKVVAEVG